MGQRSYQCPGTANYPAHVFTYFHHPSIEADPVPRFCPTCGYDSQAEDFQREITAPHIATKAAVAVDQTYRMMEAQADYRIQMAAEMTGLPVSDFTDMKITDLKSNLRTGDTAAVELPPNPVTERMAQMQSIGAPVGFTNNGAGFAQMTGQGPVPHAGLGAATQVREHFSSQSHQIIKAGEAGRF